MTPNTKDDVAARLKRIAGQIAGIHRMVEEDRYCIDVAMQLSAARAALAKVAKMVLASHIETCVVEASVASGKERREKIEELVRLFERDL
jgi:DNA-binding FrmR family transcriptional regulator